MRSAIIVFCLVAIAGVHAFEDDSMNLWRTVPEQRLNGAFARKPLATYPVTIIRYDLSNLSNNQEQGVTVGQSNNQINSNTNVNAAVGLAGNANIFGSGGGSGVWALLGRRFGRA